VSKGGFERLAVSLGSAIRARRLDAGKTLEALAYESGVSVRRLLEIEKGRTDPRLSTIHKIATALLIKVGELIKF
jgi:transcriptional regulator with XRE-family HTH domain